jgi:hypothetical protein
MARVKRRIVMLMCELGEERWVGAETDMGDIRVLYVQTVRTWGTIRFCEAWHMSCSLSAIDHFADTEV